VCRAAAVAANTAFSLLLQDQVEDTKGNNGVTGELTLTNLRLTWVNKKVRRTNISVGLGNITSLSVLPANKRLKGGHPQAPFQQQHCQGVT
jgi:hypothetical protein